MGYLDYNYLEVGFLHPFTIIVMAIVLLISTTILAFLLGTRNKNSIAHHGSNWNTLKALVRQNYIGKYSNSYIGIIWNFLIPIILACVICGVFTSIKELHSGRGYGIYLCAGFFVAAICRYGLTGRSFKSNSQMVKKMTTPGWIIVIADTISQFITLVIALITTLVIKACIGSAFSAEALAFIPILLALAFVLCFGLSLLFSTVAVLWEDIGQMISMLARIIVWITPVFFYLCDCKSTLENICMWNPFTGLIELFHQTFSYNVVPNAMMLISSSLITALVLVIGLTVYSLCYDKVREQI